MGYKARASDTGVPNHPSPQPNKVFVNRQRSEKTKHLRPFLAGPANNFCVCLFVKDLMSTIA
jgi:hypothetical protein